MYSNTCAVSRGNNYIRIAAAAIMSPSQVSYVFPAGKNPGVYIKNTKCLLNASKFMCFGEPIYVGIVESTEYILDIMCSLHIIYHML